MKKEFLLMALMATTAFSAQAALEELNTLEELRVDSGIKSIGLLGVNLVLTPYHLMYKHTAEKFSKGLNFPASRITGIALFASTSAMIYYTGLSYYYEQKIKAAKETAKEEAKKKQAKWFWQK